MFDDVIATANSKLAVNEGDYFKDGLLYCGKCNTPKQARLKCFGNEQIVRSMCQCESDEYDRRDAEYRERDRLEAIERRRGVSFDNREMSRWTFAEDDGKTPQLTDACKNFVENFAKFKSEGKGILFYGTVGTGKTFYTACIINELISKGYACCMTSFPRLELRMRMATDKQEFVDSLNDYSLLAIDDLATERNTEYMNEIVQLVIDSRYRAKLPMIVSTNLTLEELASAGEIVKARLNSRLFEMCVPIEVKGADRRVKKFTDEYNEWNKLLGL